MVVVWTFPTIWWSCGVYPHISGYAKFAQVYPLAFLSDQNEPTKGKVGYYMVLMRF